VPTFDTSSSRPRGYAIALASAFAFSSTAIFIRYLTGTHGMPAGVLSFWRAALLVGTLGPLLALLRPSLLRPRRADLSLLVGQGLLLAVFNLLWTTSVARCGASLATVLVYTSGAFTALLGWWFLRERLGPWGLVAVALCLAGCALTSGVFEGAAWRGDVAGVTLGLASGALYALYTVIGRAGAQRGIDAWTMVLWAFGSNALAQLVFLALGPFFFSSAPGLSDLLWLGRSASGWAAVAGLAAGPTLFGFGLYGASLRHLKSGEANLVLTLEPPLTAAAAYVLLGERMTEFEMVGGAIILAGVLALQLKEGRKRAPAGRTPSAPARIVPES